MAIKKKNTTIFGAIGNFLNFAYMTFSFTERQEFDEEILCFVGKTAKEMK